MEVNKLSKSFGQTTVLDSVSFSAHKGDVVSILGSSGSGKSTMLRCLNLLETPNSGEIVIGNTHLSFNTTAT
ncbi:MAG: ATP-binding cassette domain-containing protein, partial [Devosia sp.]